ncbi:hypothetical protein [Glycomyces harbinensis]|uniref:Uncharacterized protein n=1 Tax=Glycomyces harbinensis TaxID=58114 RepID=A0A1G6V7Y9_9ACTN|nr:hypothetical protein [Glycomyces harbinensis]SDD49523.1 hypothetical protein SAMN05216270_104253 [Glycomyces harbinensis]
MSNPRTADEIEALGANVDTSIEELETALLEYFAPKMPAGIALDGVEMELAHSFGTWTTGLTTVGDLEALADALGTDIGRHADPEGKTILATWGRVGLLVVRFEIYFETEEERAAALERFR